MATGLLSIGLGLATLALVWGARPIDPIITTQPCEDRISAICRMRNGTVYGDILLEQISSTSVTLSGSISGLNPGNHGFHVHMYGDLSNGCANAGGHYNPFNKTHGGPRDTIRHVGDLGNLGADNQGYAHISISDNQLRLCGPNSVAGRAIVIHANQDDLGTGGDAESLRTGNAGPRVGCCVIGYASN